MDHHELLPRLFRTEYSKIAAVLCKFFGFDKMDLAEDIASETFLTALETWTYKGIPDNPTAWLYTVARNKARNVLARENLFAEKIVSHIRSNGFPAETHDVDLSEQNINDSQLQMLFAICVPAIPAEAQIGLALRILCGFGIDEIANAFLTNKETINKRLFRAKEKLRAEKIRIEFPGETEITNRLENVLRTLYLLFSEGYYSESTDNIVREDLCYEAMRLSLLLMQNEQTDRPTVNAAYALMCFQASRLRARKNSYGEIILYDDQDEALWDQELIARGAFYLNRAARGNELSSYHIEAAIAYWNTQRSNSPDKWKNILQLYDRLAELETSPVVLLNRVFAFSKVHGKERAIREAEKFVLADNHFYFALLGELFSGLDNTRARTNFQRAFSMAKTAAEKQILQKKLAALGV